MNEDDFAFVGRLVKEKSGLVLPGDKQYLVESRLSPLARETGCRDLGELIARLRRPDALALRETVVEAMTTNESLFFRDKVPFEHFAGVMMPYLLTERAASRHIRIWCAAASTGQEPYSLAMSLLEMGPRVAGWRIEIIGTDISTQALDRARNGFYSQFEVQRGLPQQMLAKYFTQRAGDYGEMWEIAPQVRSMVTYRKYNLLDPFASLGQFDIVFCRNVLIYFDPQTKADVLERVARQLAPDGFMMLGAAETVVGLTEAFHSEAGRRGLFRLSSHVDGRKDTFRSGGMA
ncbi:CheR family methyltransferase [Pseudochelatococcus contaminans]|uniref:Chemotaxis protein methyltransferase n=1 Tax=Pseudochelatococcus contaminans TaxID=1538103 RepID=A0A7W6EEX5_9HYPH|nr:protein-glutamate O-methyltransferase CheR [Pseudochelatococcus contaminans]MBB3807997.1 chemotaxis protein methyltransferase CheR [Pseudochelatococcus contaminans]